jgi:methylated-DNA-[protein]-cysteine S-methyltransferase
LGKILGEKRWCAISSRADDHPEMLRIGLDSPVGRMTLFEEDGAIVALDWGGRRGAGEPSRLLVEAKRQIGAYFAGKRKEFDLPLHPHGSERERAIWRAMADIRYGQTRTYGEIARELGVPARLVGQACGRNPIPILLPCHRVVSAKGLGGFSAPGGVEWKRRLLMHEGALLL